MILVTSVKYSLYSLKTVNLRLSHSISAQLHKTERDHPELMKVPPPVLAATLEPDFLVVPGNSYFSDSPPSSAAGGALRERSIPHEQKCSETRASSVIEVKKERFENAVEPRRSSSGSSTFSQTSDSSRSPSESLEKPSSVDTQKRQYPACDIESHINKISDHENISREQQSNGESQKSNSGATSDSQVTKSTPSRLSLLNSNASEPASPTQLSPKKSPVRLIKVSPLNSAISGNSGVELRRPSLEYTTNHGIVRISSATSMTSPMTSPKHVESSTLSNNMLKNAVTSYVSSKDSDVQMVTTYSVAQIGNADDRKCTSPSKRPNILSKNRNQNKKDIPQGIVVLVPTIEDAKQLIKSSGGNQSKTPVLVPQNVLDRISSNGESSKSNTDPRVKSSFVEKRPQYADSNLTYSRSKRRLSESMVID